jgi:hypothetical protein
MSPWIIKRPDRDDTQTFIDMERVSTIRIESSKAKKKIEAAGKHVNVVGDRLMEDALKRASKNLEERLHVLDNLVNDGPKLVLIAGKGTGKTFLSNVLCESWIQQPEAAFDSIVKNAIQPVGDGGTTPCEFRYEYSENWGIDIKPADYHDVWQLVEPMLAMLARKRLKIQESVDLQIEENDDGPTEPTQREAIVAPTGLKSFPSAERIAEIAPIEADKERTIRGICFRGQLPSEQDIRTLLAARTIDIWRDEVVKAAGLERRQEQSIRLIPTTDDADRKVWMQTQMIRILKGLVPDQPFPKCVTVSGPIFPRIANGPKVTIIDTLGLPPPSKHSALFARADIRTHIQDEGALLLFAASGENPPEPTTSDISAVISNRFETDETSFDQRHQRIVVGVVFKNPVTKRLLDDDDDDGLYGRSTTKLDICKSELRIIAGADKIRYGGVHIAESRLNAEFRSVVQEAFAAMAESTLERAEAAIELVLQRAKEGRENKALLNRKIEAAYRAVVLQHQPLFQAWQERVRTYPLSGLIAAVLPFRLNGWMHHMSVYSMALGNGTGASYDTELFVLSDISEKEFSGRSINYTRLMAAFREDVYRKCLGLEQNPKSIDPGDFDQDAIDYVKGTYCNPGKARAVADALVQQVETALQTVAHAVVDSLGEVMRDDAITLWTHSKAPKRRSTMIGIWEDKLNRPVKLAWARKLEAWQEEHRETLVDTSDALIAAQLAVSGDVRHAGEFAWMYPETVELPAPVPLIGVDQD